MKKHREAEMFYLAAGSESMFLVAIAIIAAMVVIFMAVATFVLLRSENKKATQVPPNDEAKPIPPVEMTAAPPPKERAEDALPSNPPVEDVAASLPKEIPQHDQPAIPSIEIVADPPPKARTRIELQLSPGVIRVTKVIRSLFIRLLWAIGLVAALIFSLPIVLYIVALAIVLVAAFRWAGPINVLHMAMGFLGWFVINTLLWIWLLGADWRGDPWGLFRGFILLCVNIPALLVVSLGGRWIILGVFLWILVNAIGTLLFIALGLIEYEGHFNALMPSFFLSLFYPSL
jgi:hypothetical protein